MTLEEKIDLFDRFTEVNSIDPSFYEQYRVKRGLRNADGSGVIAGVTNISNVHGYVLSEGDKRPDEGVLTFRGYRIGDLLQRAPLDGRFAYEEIAYLLLMGELPTEEQLREFIAVIDSFRELPDGFTASMIMRNTPPDIMNVLARSVLLTPMPKTARSTTRSRRLFRSFRVCRASWCSRTTPNARASTTSP